MKLEEARPCIKKYEDATHDQLESFNSSEAFYKAYPELVEDIVCLDGGSDHQSTTTQDLAYETIEAGAIPKSRSFFHLSPTTNSPHNKLPRRRIEASARKCAAKVQNGRNSDG